MGDRRLICWTMSASSTAAQHESFLDKDHWTDFFFVPTTRNEFLPFLSAVVLVSAPLARWTSQFRRWRRVTITYFYLTVIMSCHRKMYIPIHYPQPYLWLLTYSVALRFTYETIFKVEMNL